MTSMHALLIPVDPIVALAAGLTILFVIIIVLELVNRRAMARLEAPSLEYARAQADEEAARIIEEARKEARDLVARAEAAGAELAARRRAEDDEAAKTHRAALDAIQERFAKALEEAARAAESANEGARKELQGTLASLGQSARHELETASTAASAEFAKDLRAAIDEARAGVDAYARVRKEAITAHIRELVTETTRLVLARSLPDEVNAKLVTEALEEAQAAGAFQQL